MRGRESAGAEVDRWARSDWWGVVLDCPDALALATFYSELLGWPMPQPVATLPTRQPQDDVRVLIDPAGHPFCLYT